MTVEPIPEDTRAAEPYRYKKVLWWEWLLKTLTIMGMVFWFINLDDPGQSLTTLAGWTTVAYLLVPIVVLAAIWRMMDILSRRLQGLPIRQEAILRSQWRRQWISAALLTGVSMLWIWLFVLDPEAPQITAAFLCAVGAVWTALDLWRLRHRQVPDETVEPE